MDINIEKFVKEHGHILHTKIVQKLRDNGWTVIISPFYRDNATDKARESDIIAEKEIKFGMNGSPMRKEGFFRVRLIIECKYVKEPIPIVFWFDKKDLDATEERIIKDISLFEKSSKNNSILSHHWRSSGEAAKLFATYNPSGQEKQTENEIVFSAIDKVLNCLINYRDRQSIIGENKRLAEGSCFYKPIINYPIIVFNDFSKLYETTVANPEVIKTFSRDPSFEIEINYDYVRYINGIRLSFPEYFLIDVVNFNKLEDYLKILKNKDLTAALNFI